jgi:uncharacterized membrane protein
MGANDTSTTERVVAVTSALALAFGLVVGLVILADVGTAIVAFILLSVVPALLGYAGLKRTDWVPSLESSGGDADEDLVAELKRRYAEGELSEAEMERKVETLLTAGEGPGGGSSERERERDRARR